MILTSVMWKIVGAPRDHRKQARGGGRESITTRGREAIAERSSGHQGKGISRLDATAGC